MPPSMMYCKKLATISKYIRRIAYQVVSAVDLGVKVNNGSTVVETTISANAGGSDVVAAT